MVLKWGLEDMRVGTTCPFKYFSSCKMQSHRPHLSHMRFYEGHATLF